MNKEMLMIIAMGTGGICFSLGGTGFKWVRRFLLPAILAILTILGGILWWKALAMGGCLIAALCLPYGKKTPYPVKFLVMCSYFASTLWLGFSYWQAIGLAIAIILFKLSNTKWTQNIVFWKAWEFITGSLIGITVSSLL